MYSSRKYLVLLLFILSCNNQRKLTSYIKPLKEVNKKIDSTVFQNISFLFVVDTSESMDILNTKLGDNLKSFLEPLFTKFPNYNYNFAFTEMSSVPSPENNLGINTGINPGPGNNPGINPRNHPGLQSNSTLLSLLPPLEGYVNCGDAGRDENILSFTKDTKIGSYLSYSRQDLQDHSTHNLICILSNNIQKVEGPGNKNIESYFESLERIVEESKSIELFKSNFFGKKNLLVLVFISDAYAGITDGITDWTGKETQATKRALEPINALLKTGLKKKNIHPYAIVTDADNSDRCGEGNKKEHVFGRYPYHMYEFIEALDGLRFSICKGDWGTDLQAVFDDLKSFFQSNIINLGEVPQLSSLQVLLNGKVIPNDAINGWSYNPETVSIIISEDFDKLPYLNSETKGDENLFTIRYNAVNIDLLLDKKNTQ